MATLSVLSPHAAAWRWFAQDVAGGENWLFHTEEPRSLLERRITRPKLSRLLAAIRCARQAQVQDCVAIAAHSPYSTLWVSLAQCPMGSRIPIFAFSFHFETLPAGVKLLLARWAFRRVHCFVVHSTPEKERYATHFGLDADRFHLQRWGVRANSTQVENETPELRGCYICALGKDGRDYRTLIQAMAKLPALTLAIVAQPRNLKGLEIPDNVKIFCDIPAERAMNILKNSQFMALPLQTGETSCGHITLVSAMFSRKAILATYSAGIADYFPPGYDHARIPAGDVDAWAEQLSAMAADPARRQACADKGEAFAHAFCSHEAVLKNTLALFEKSGVRLGPNG